MRRLTSTIGIVIRGFGCFVSVFVFRSHSVNDDHDQQDTDEQSYYCAADDGWEEENQNVIHHKHRFSFWFTWLIDPPIKKHEIRVTGEYVIRCSEISIRKWSGPPPNQRGGRGCAFPFQTKNKQNQRFWRCQWRSFLWIFARKNDILKIYIISYVFWRTLYLPSNP